MQDTIARYGEPKNEPVFGYLPGSAERAALKAELAKLGSASADVPLYIGGERVRTGKTRNLTSPHSHRHSLGVFHQGGAGGDLKNRAQIDVTEDILSDEDSAKW